MWEARVSRDAQNVYTVTKVGTVHNPRNLLGLDSLSNFLELFQSTTLSETIMLPKYPLYFTK